MLFEFAPLRIWSLFVNFCVAAVDLLMFVAEYAVRRRVLPQVQRSGIIAAMRVYFARFAAEMHHGHDRATVPWLAHGGGRLSRRRPMTAQQFLDEARAAGASACPRPITC